MSNTDTNVGQRPRGEAIAIRRHHLRWGILIAILLLGGIATGAFYLGGGNITRDASGVYNLTPPTVPQVRLQASQNQVVNPTIATNNGSTTAAPASPALPQAAAVDPAAGLANGRTRNDAIGPTGTLQRTEVDVNRYDPIDRINGRLDAFVTRVDEKFNTLAKVIADGADATNRAVQNVAGQVQSLAGTVNGIDERVKGLDGRITALENRPSASVAPPAVVPAPAPAASPAAVPGPQAANGSTASADVIVTGVPKNWHITGVAGESSANRCTRASGRKLVLTNKPDPRVPGNYLFECVPLSDPRQAVS